MEDEGADTRFDLLADALQLGFGKPTRRWVRFQLLLFHLEQGVRGGQPVALDKLAHAGLGGRRWGGRWGADAGLGLVAGGDGQAGGGERYQGGAWEVEGNSHRRYYLARTWGARAKFTASGVEPLFEPCGELAHGQLRAEPDCDEDGEEDEGSVVFDLRQPA